MRYFQINWNKYTLSVFPAYKFRLCYIGQDTKPGAIMSPPPNPAPGEANQDEANLSNDNNQTYTAEHDNQTPIANTQSPTTERNSGMGSLRYRRITINSETSKKMKDT